MNKFLPVLAAATILLAGCMAGQYGTGHITPEDTIALQLESWRTAMQSQDVDAIMACFSDRFEHHSLHNKEAMRSFITQAIEQGQLDGLTIDFEDARIKADSDVGSVYPVELTGNFGAMRMELIVRRTNGAWLITGLDAPEL